MHSICHSQGTLLPSKEVIDSILINEWATKSHFTLRRLSYYLTLNIAVAGTFTSGPFSMCSQTKGLYLKSQQEFSLCPFSFNRKFVLCNLPQGRAEDSQESSQLEHVKLFIITMTEISFSKHTLSLAEYTRFKCRCSQNLINDSDQQLPLIIKT